jgi:uncharacterized protein YoxC
MNFGNTASRTLNTVGTTVGNAVGNIGTTFENTLNNVGKVVNDATVNVMKGLSPGAGAISPMIPTGISTNLNKSLTNVGNAVGNVVNNTVNNTMGAVGGVGEAVENVGTAINNTAMNFGKNFGKNLGNNLFNNPVANMVQTSLTNSISAVPTSAPPLALSLPLIIGIGTLVIIMILIVLFRTSIENAWNSFMSTAKGGAVDVETAGSDLADEIKADLDMKVNTVLPTKKEVFNVSENKYTYADAEPLCRSLGAELATYDQVHEAWKQGADWCNYGWVKGQSAVYPTQKSTFDKIQSTATNDDQRLMCGLPGINGGVFDNPDLKFGVNCFGNKPDQSDHDMKIKMANQVPPLDAQAMTELRKELRYKENRDQIGINPFNQSSWT